MLEKADDGSFWMDVKDLCKHYADVGISKVKGEYFSNSLKIKAEDDTELKTS
jgi:hypothetical protein